MFKKFIIKKELILERRNNTSLFLITPTMIVLITVFPILIENRFKVHNDLFTVVELMYLIIFSTLFSIRNPLEETILQRELNFASIKVRDYFFNKTLSELIIFLPQLLLMTFLFKILTNTSLTPNILYFLATLLFFSLNSIMINLFFQFFTAFNSRFVQFTLITPIYIGLTILIAPIWLGVNLEVSNIYLIMYIGITLITYSFTNFYLREV